jgi:7-carboxy-7-deazaguanine synthase
MNLPINEIFSSCQGEGSYTGMPSVFVRLQACFVGCIWCDTRHTWEKHGKDIISFGEMLAKEKDAPTWADVDLETLVNYLEKQPERHIVITGGEPCMYDLTVLTDWMLGVGKTVQIETSGTQEIEAHQDSFITLSPKIGMPGGYQVLMSAVHRANEIKMPVGKMADVDKLKNFLKEYNRVDLPMVYLQPLSQSEKATELCIEQARLNGWRLSAQLHKFLKIR